MKKSAGEITTQRGGSDERLQASYGNEFTQKETIVVKDLLLERDQLYLLRSKHRIKRVERRGRYCHQVFVQRP